MSFIDKRFFMCAFERVRGMVPRFRGNLEERVHTRSVEPKSRPKIKCKGA